jgi:hypothetical protein
MYCKKYEFIFWTFIWIIQTCFIPSVFVTRSHKGFFKPNVIFDILKLRLFYKKSLKQIVILLGQ